jgi:hypothetical protein
MITEAEQLDERFKILVPSDFNPKAFDDIYDPNGYADYLADLEYHDFY